MCYFRRVINSTCNSTQHQYPILLQRLLDCLLLNRQSFVLETLTSRFLNTRILSRGNFKTNAVERRGNVFEIVQSIKRCDRAIFIDNKSLR